jgi:hypothetical protein
VNKKKNKGHARALQNGSQRKRKRVGKKKSEREKKKTNMREHGGDSIACGALDVHEVAVGGRHQPLHLVLASLGLSAGEEQIVFELKKREKRKR